MTSPASSPLLFRRRPSSRPWWAPLGLALAMLAGCASLQPEKQLARGQSEAAVLQLMGQPTNRYAMPEGATRLEYARGPAGYTTWMVDLDAKGQVTGFESVLNTVHFNRVTRGMTADELLRLLGRPTEKQREYTNRVSWYWRHTPYECLWYAVTLSPQGLVIGGASELPDPRCDPTL